MHSAVSSAYFPYVNSPRKRWGTSSQTLGEAICVWLCLLYFIIIFFFFFLLTGKTERGSYSSYGRDSNLQGCHQVSEKPAQQRGCGKYSEKPGVFCQLYISGPGSAVSGDGCSCAFPRTGLSVQMPALKFQSELCWPGCSSWRLRGPGLTRYRPSRSRREPLLIVPCRNAARCAAWRVLPDGTTCRNSRGGNAPQSLRRPLALDGYCNKL